MIGLLTQLADFGRLLLECVQYYQQGHIQPIKPIKCFKVTEIADAFRLMKRGTHIGKLTVRMPNDIDDLPCTARHPALPLHPDASYLLVGGLGGIGRSIASWLVQNGARNLIFLSRSGRSEKTEHFLQELEALGCNVQVFAGSVTDIENVQEVVAKAQRPIRGVIQLSMVLRVSTDCLSWIGALIDTFRTELLIL